MDDQRKKARVAGPEAGASLIAVMVAAALTLVAVSGAVIAYRQIVFARRVGAAANAATEVESIVVAQLVQSFQTYVQSKCTNSAALSSIGLGNNSFMTRATQVSVTPQRAGSTLPYPPEAQTSVARCQQTPLARPLSGQPASVLYSCFPITINSATKKDAKDSFANSKSPFIEAVVRIRNFQNDTPLPCSTAVNAMGGGLAIYYTLHWVLDTNEGYVFKSKTGVVDVSL